MKRITLKETELVNLIKKVINEQAGGSIFLTQLNQMAVGDAHALCQLCKGWYFWASGSVQQECTCPGCVCDTMQYDPQVHCKLCKAIYFYASGSVDDCNDICNSTWHPPIEPHTPLGVDRDFRGPKEDRPLNNDMM
jgi:hypothetical protein